MNIKGYVEFIVRDKNGRVISKRKRRSHSFVKQFTQGKRGEWRQGTAPESNVRDTTNNLRDTYGRWYIDAPANNSLYGIVVGTGTTAVDASDYKLATQIVHGTETGQLSHKIMEFDAFQLVGQIHSFRSKRLFVNDSGATITIGECGIYGLYTYYFCIVRDVVSPTVNVGATQSLEVRYTFQVTTS